MQTQIQSILLIKILNGMIVFTVQEVFLSFQIVFQLLTLQTIQESTQIQENRDLESQQNQNIQLGHLQPLQHI